MAQVMARLPDELIRRMDEAAETLHRSRAQDSQDLKLALERLRDPADAILDWRDVKRELLDQDRARAPRIARELP